MKINVTATRCIVENDVELNAGEYNINKFYFTFSPEYLDNYVKKALFVAKDQPPIEMVIANDECNIPYDILKKPGTYMFGVYAYEVGDNEELILRYSPEPTHFYVNRGSYIENAETPTDPDPDEFAQYYQAMQDLISNTKPEFKEYIDENLPTVEIGEVTTLTPGSQATVTNSGTDRNPIFNFGIPEGLKGDSVGAIEIDSNDETYQIKMKLYDDNGQIIAESNTIDLPIENKVDKINGKSLSTNDFTDELKNKLDNVEDYAEVNVIQTISKNGTPITVEGKNVNIVVPTNTSDLNNDSGFITSEVSDLENYYDKTVSDNKFALITESGKIIDLSIDNSTYVMTITLKDRDANVLSSSDVDLPLETMVINASYDSNTKEIVLTLKNGNTTRFSVAGLVSGLQSEITSTNKLKSDLVDDNKQTNKFVTLNEKTTWNNKSDFSGSYNDLTDVPTIPTQVTESTVSGWGFTKNTGTYIKPSTGIPKTDLASGVQTSLEKADTALQSISSSDVTTALGYTPYNSTNPNGYTSNTGTITGVKMNGSTIASSGVADLGTVITKHQDISEKQDKIVAGTNISIASDGKTISATDTTYSNATTTTAGLMSSDDKTKLNGIETGATKNLNYYGTCATAAATQAKVVECEGFALEEGATISVLFTYAQTYNGVPTLNVNSTGAKNIQYKAGTNAVQYIWSAGEIIDFTYNGTYWIMHRSALATTTYYGIAKYSDSLTSTSSALGLTPKAINTAMTNIISGTPIYSASSTYAVGDRVRYSNNVWECITAIATAEAWTAAHWQEVAPLQEQIDDKQDLLVSGTNIKTINNQSILGSGNITIEGGGSGTVDTAMSDSSTNAVQNKVIKSYIDDMVGDIGTILDNINGEVIGG